MSVRSLVPMVFVASVARSMGFYQKLGLEVGKTHGRRGPPGRP
jgi:hypothetical protein